MKSKYLICTTITQLSAPVVFGGDPIPSVTNIVILSEATNKGQALRSLEDGQFILEATVKG